MTIETDSNAATTVIAAEIKNLICKSFFTDLFALLVIKIWSQAGMTLGRLPSLRCWTGF